MFTTGQDSHQNHQVGGSLETFLCRDGFNMEMPGRLQSNDPMPMYMLRMAVIKVLVAVVTFRISPNNDLFLFEHEREQDPIALPAHMVAQGFLYRKE
jgi:hypothetical protein